MELPAAFGAVIIAVTGANSGVGSILLRHLAARDDLEVVAGVRSASAAAALPPSPRLSARVIDYADVDGLTAALTGATCVVHLAGILFEGPGTTYQTANVGATDAVAAASARAGVSHIVLVSVLGADPGSANRYLSSKGRAEHAVAASGLSATIIRTPILLGPGMAGAKAVVHAASQPTVTLLGGGRHVTRPLDVDDLSRAILASCDARRPGVAIHELVGPEAVPYRDVITRTAARSGREVAIRSLPIWLARLGASVAGLTRKGGMTPTVIDVITSSETVHTNADLELGVTLTPLSATLDKLLPANIKVRQP